MIMINTLVKILGITKPTYYRWKQENRPIITILNKYFYKNDLVEFLETEEMTRFKNLEKVQFLTYESLTQTHLIITNIKTFPRKIMSREGFYIIVYRMILEYDQTVDQASFIKFIQNYQLFTLKNMQNILTPLERDAGKDLFKTRLSEHEILFIIENKALILPIIKSLMYKGRKIV